MTHHSFTLDAARKEKRTAAASSVAAALGLTAMKLVVGLGTGSLGLLAEAAHSGLDLVAALVTFFAVKVSDKPPDDTHLYGHGKVENFSALVETALLILTCAWIVYEAVRRLIFHEVEITPSLAAFLVVLVSIVVDVNRSRMLSRVARRHDSQALEADALHFSTDVWSSSVVLLGLALVWLGQNVFPGGAGILLRADAAAALGVACIVFFVSYRLGKRTIDVLLDRAPEGLREKFAAAAAEVESVMSVGTIRLRRSGARVFVDMTIEVDRTLSFERTHAIAEEVEACIQALVPAADVVIHTDPRESERETLARRIRAIAERSQAPVHNINVHDDSGALHVDLHLEVDDHLLLHQAHDQASRIERELKREIPSIKRVNTHIESRRTGIGEGTDVTASEQRMVEAVKRVTDGVAGRPCCHNIVIRRQAGRFAVSLHCGFDKDLPVIEAHRLSTRIEEALKREMPTIEQVLVHTEPEET